MKKLLTILICLTLLSACTPDTYIEDVADRDYSLNHLQLGLSYVPDSNDTYRASTKEHINTLGIKSVRVGYNWALREPEAGQYNYDAMDQRMAFYTSLDIEVLLTIDLKQIPEWTSVLTEEAFKVSYREMIQGLLSRYGENIQIIQLGNEWDWEIQTHLDGNEDLYISLSNILYEEVSALEGDKPKVALGSISIGGLRSLAFYEGEIDNVYFKKGPLYTEAEIGSLSDEIEEVANVASKLFSSCRYDMVDLHLYDDYWSWSIYVDVIKETYLKQSNVSIIVSEFGGPEPSMEPSDDSYRADQLYYYIKSLDSIGIDQAYYFKLHETLNSDSVFHKGSFLIQESGGITETYDVMESFATNDRE